jgi:hypothetical protein
LRLRPPPGSCYISRASATAGEVSWRRERFGIGPHVSLYRVQ